MKDGVVAAIVGIAMLSFLVLFSPVSAVSSPTIFSSNGLTAVGVNSLSVPLNSTAGDSLVVFEWIAFFQPTACSSLLVPIDSNTNTWSDIGNCLLDSNGGAIQAFYVQNNTQSAVDTINCNFGSVNGHIIACYAFDVSGGGAINLIASQAGTGTPIRIGNASQMFTASPNTLLLGMAGIQLYCQSVGLGGVGFQAYNPASACNNFGGLISNYYGLSGEFFSVGSGGLTTFFPMTTGHGNIIWGELVVQIAPASAVTTTTSYTATIVGWLTPDAAHYANSLILMTFPLIGMVFGLIPFMMFQKDREIGDKAIYPSLFGLMGGSLAADLSVNGTSVLQIPFAVIVVELMLLFLWWWSS